MQCKTCKKELDSSLFYKRRLSCKSCVIDKTIKSRMSNCSICGSITTSGTSKFCRSCSMKGERGSNYKGGKQKKEGYIYILKHGYPGSNSRGTIAEHRYVMEQFLGRLLLPEENVHHKNGIRDDNRIENLELWTRNQPVGSRVEDLIDWSINFLVTNGYKVTK